MYVKKKIQKGRVTLERAISKLGIASRTEARGLIESGKVKVHGSVEKNASRMVNPNTAHIEVLGAKAIKSESLIILMHKPNGVLTTKRDPEGRKTVYDVLPKEYQSFHPVGRLDMNTSGLLLFTNDTKISSFLTDPKNQIKRTYLATVRGEFTEEKASRAVFGLEDKGEWLQAGLLTIKKASGKESLLEIVLTEGKNREVRRLCESLGHEVVKLKRVSFGEYAIDDLKVGEVRLLESCAPRNKSK